MARQADLIKNGMEGVAILEEYTGQKKKKLPPLPPHQEVQHRRLTPFLRPEVPPTEDPIICRYRGGQSCEAVTMQTYLCAPKQEPQMKQEVAIDWCEIAKSEEAYEVIEIGKGQSYVDRNRHMRGNEELLTYNCAFWMSREKVDFFSSFINDVWFLGRHIESLVFQELDNNPQLHGRWERDVWLSGSPL
ncbi:hypothetical protein RHSIM_Rhsim04G0226900 [Rhododendron simsii]|uniref:Uncharacterized protein n=1 Tax=Rhododendron simsii TaxID=118357 RepID=A0A834H3A0_RHOSS|nr:hypothetical protein RHSIM_Rhsim04G0226900 [Rhododendron simsii]